MSQSQSLYLYLILPVVILLAWSYTAMVLRGSLPVLRNKAIVLLIAHPDDEAMFFAPSVLALTRSDLGNHLKILCLSNGNADGLGAIRRHEIVQSGKRLGLRSEEDVLVLDEPDFPDSMTTSWPADKISALLSSLFVSKNNSSSSSSSNSNTTTSSTSSSGSTATTINRSSSSNKKAQETTIDAIITFDGSGVSGHANHISLYHGAVAWARSLMTASRHDQQQQQEQQQPVQVYTLTSVNMLRKYAGVLDAPFTLAWNAGGGLTWKNRSGSSSSSKKTKAMKKEWPQRIMFVNDVGQWTTAMGAMANAHKSQMVWFRWGWISIGRYMVVNDLRRVVLG